MSSRLADSLELCNGLQSAAIETRAGRGELESVLDGIFNELPEKIEGITAEREVEQTTPANQQQEIDQFRRQITAVIDQLTLVQRDQAVQAAELQAAREQNAAMAEELADQKRQTQHWHEIAQQKLVEIGGITARQREIEQTTAADHRQETEQCRQQIAAVIEQLTLVQHDQAVHAAELQAALEQNAAMAEQLADQTGQAQHWQEMAQQKLAEIERITAQQREAEQAAANCRQETDQFRQQIAELAGQQALIERDQAIQAAELQAAREQNLAMAEELADQTRQSRHWQEMAQQKLAEVERITAQEREAEQAAANCRQETDQFRQHIAELAGQQALVERDQAIQAAELQAAREQNAAMAEELADQTRQSQHWQEMAQQKLAEIERITAQQREAEQTATANHCQETDQFRQQIAELAGQQALIERDQAIQAAELQTAREQNAAMAEQLADQTRQAQHWHEMAQQKLGEIERITAQQREAEQAAADCRQETDQLRRQIAALVDQQALAERELVVPPAELQAALEQNAAMAEQLAGQTRQTQHWQEIAQRKLAEIEGIAAQQANVEQSAALNYRQEGDRCRQQIAELIDEQALVKRAQAVQAAELQTAREQNLAMAEELADQKRQTQHWQEMADCAKQVAELRALLEHQKACQEAQLRASGETAAAATASQSADLGHRLDRREDSSRLQPAHCDSVTRQTPPDRGASQSAANGQLAAESPQEFSEQDRLMAQRQAQWETLLRTRSRTHK